MSTKVKLGGDNRVGSGNDMMIEMHGFNRSNHDLGFVWRSTMASGTLVPFMTEVGLMGDSHDIDLTADVQTNPTTGALFGSYKLQLDLYTIPVRLYNGKLHMNMNNVGLKMDKVKLPQIRIEAWDLNKGKGDVDNAQINPSSILAHLNIRGIGYAEQTGLGEHFIRRDFNAIPWLAYWDIVKNYYANSQEEIGYVIHNGLKSSVYDEVTATWEREEAVDVNLIETRELPERGDPNAYGMIWDNRTSIKLNTVGMTEWNPEDLYVSIGDAYRDNWQWVRATDIYSDYEMDTLAQIITYKTARVNGFMRWGEVFTMKNFYIGEANAFDETRPMLEQYNLAEVDAMRIRILKHIEDYALVLSNQTELEMPYAGLFANKYIGDQQQYSYQSTQEGLAVKTYQSDLFNNWLSTEWIEGENGINEITAIDTSSGSIKIDEINLANKIYNMLNRIAVSGGSYDDWLEAVYDHKGVRRVENPMYIGGMSQEIVFQEVVSNAATENEPLGTLAGRGRLAGDKRGGNIKVNIDEPSYIMGIVSITPRIDYSQGNRWDTNLKTMDDFHKPPMDEIGFQDLVTDQLAWWDTRLGLSQTPNAANPVKFRKAGKQPAWINYTTNVNIVRGNFAIETQEMFQVLVRRYEMENQGEGLFGIMDLTTYIDPSKFNHIFADTRLDAQNFKVQIRVGNRVRRKMSARLMPNL